MIFWLNSRCDTVRTKGACAYNLYVSCSTTFSYCVLIFHTSDNCWKVQFALSVNVAKSPISVTWCPISERATPPQLYRYYRLPVLETNILRKLQESVLFEMTDKALCAINLFSKVCMHENKILTATVCYFDSPWKFVVDTNFIWSTFKPDTTVPNVKWLVFLFHNNFAEIFFASMSQATDHMLSVFACGYRLS